MKTYQDRLTDVNHKIQVSSQNQERMMNVNMKISIAYGI